MRCVKDGLWCFTFDRFMSKQTFHLFLLKQYSCLLSLVLSMYKIMSVWKYLYFLVVYSFSILYLSKLTLYIHTVSLECLSVIRTISSTHTAHTVAKVTAWSTYCSWPLRPAWLPLVDTGRDLTDLIIAGITKYLYTIKIVSILKVIFNFLIRGAVFYFYYCYIFFLKETFKRFVCT